MLLVVLENNDELMYLRHVLDAYTRKGINADELPLAMPCYAALQNAQQIDPQKMTVSEASPNHIVMSAAPQEPEPPF